MKSLRLFRYTLFTALRSIRNGWKLHALTAGSVTSVFLVFVGGLLLFQNVRSIFLGSQGETEFTVYFREGKENVGREEIQTQFCSQEFVRRCTFISKETAKKKFVQTNPDLASAVSTLDENPFPALMRIEIDSSFRDTDRLRTFAGAISVLPNVEGIEEAGEWLVTWFRLLNLVDLLFVAIMLALGAATIFVVSNTIRILVYARRDEVDILALVGASDRIIRAPFWFEGMIQGGVGALLSLGILRLLFEQGRQVIANHFGGLLLADFVFFSVSFQIGAVVAGVLLGWIGSALAVGRFLRS